MKDSRIPHQFRTAFVLALSCVALFLLLLAGTPRVSISVKAFGDLVRAAIDAS